MSPELSKSAELERLLKLSEFDLDYSNLAHHFKDLTLLAAKIAGTDISLLNLIDNYTQWSVANFGFDLDQMPREDSVCQYTILEDDHFEVEDLSADARFKDKFYVGQPHSLRYYFGVPLKTKTGHHIGALCVLDKDLKKLSPEKIELLKIIAGEIITRLNTMKVVQDLTNSLKEEKETNKKAAHDIRGPLAGIIGIAELITEQGKENNIDEVLELVNMIHRSSKSILDLANEILTEKKAIKAAKDYDFNLLILKERIIKLYTPQAKSKHINFTVNTNINHISIPFSKSKVLQIVGNLISNAIKFTEENGSVTVDLDLNIASAKANLNIVLHDSGIGISEEAINNIFNGRQETTAGTKGEQGFGFGLSMVKNLLETLHGTMQIDSIVGKGTRFQVTIPQYL